MKRARSAALAFMIVFALGSCGPNNSPEALAKANIALMKDFAATLAKVTDKASAEKQTAALEQIGKRAKDLQARMAKAGEPSDAAAEKLLKEIGPAMETSMQQLSQELIRISSNPELQAVLGPTLEDMDF